ncbi:carbohydrate kinase family protein [Geitlerinema sp. PCC 9228]|jgi:adenosine kinase|uniref:PfkB family carbohydrate kinase n=1 Tax=Geitlerinema sp. PCC 9228 TaxID=111611 RepID=UPI0008F99A4B
MSALICGSFAYDNIMVFQDRFKNHILPDQVHILNVSFLVPEMRRQFGGCAGNIAYNLKLLGGSPLPMATVGSDFGDYAEWLDKHGIPQNHIKKIDSEFTGQAFITTDLDDNQITAFHPGAMQHAHANKVADANGVKVGIVAPDGRDAMLQHAEQFAEAGIPFVFDPGQGMPMFNGEELAHFVDLATYVTLNDYEWQLLRDRTGLSENQVAERVEALVVTRGGEGSDIYAGNEHHQIPSVKPEAVNDPTGCGDAYRAGLLYGFEQDLDWPTTGRIASLMGSIKISHHGTQNHSFTPEEFKEQFQKAFGYTY